MNTNFSRIMTWLVIAIVIYVSFSIHIGLGIVAILALIGISVYNKRSAFLLQKALNESAKGNMKEALALLERAYETNRSNVAIAINFAYLTLKDGDIAKADELLERAKSQPGADKFLNNIKMNEALVRWKQDRLTEAIAILEDVHSKIKTTTVYGSLGFLYIAQGNLERALEFNLEAVDYTDSDAVVMDNLFLTRILREEWEEAAEAGEKLFALNPKFPEAYYHDAWLKLHQEDKEGALNRLDEALDRKFTAVSTEKRETVEQLREKVAAMLEPSL